MTQKKYELLKNNTITAPNGKTLYRIKALIDFGVVVAGSLGGYIEKEDNLTHTGNAWVYGDARVYGDAEVSGNALVYGNAWVYGNAEVYGDAEVSGNARVYGDALVYDNAWVYGSAEVYGDALVYGNARVYGNAWVYGDARVYGDAEVSGNADLVWFSKVGTEQGTLTVYKSKDGSLLATRGCFSGTVDEFLAKSAKVHNERIKREYRLLIEVAKSRLLGESYVPTF